MREMDEPVTALAGQPGTWARRVQDAGQFA